MLLGVCLEPSVDYIHIGDPFPTIASPVMGGAQQLINAEIFQLGWFYLFHHRPLLPCLTSLSSPRVRCTLADWSMERLEIDNSALLRWSKAGFRTDLEYYR